MPDHSHDHDHDHDRRIDRAFAFGVVLNSAYVVAEFGYGFAADSVALLADAAHNLGDVLGLLIAWGAAWLARRSPSGQRTYGLRKSTVLAALANALLLIAATGALTWEAIERLADPPAPTAVTMMVVAGIGVVINLLSAVILLRSDQGHGHGHGQGHGHSHGHGHEHGHGSDLNLRGAFVHMAADAAVSLGVVVTGALLLFTGWRWLDPVVSLVIAVVIFVGTWSLLREALNLALDAAPRHIDLDRVRAYLGEHPRVVEVHDLHVWALGTRDVALTAHLVVDGQAGDLVRDAERELSTRFGIAHSTLQLESSGDRPCPQRC
ncbi:cation diffusion facilitator family transporter [Enhygromyxa salina]|uniref:Cadmium, cobalt and zinc/H(+)-K(+) antiporter n=1 Tax=Enhygromyxa salina TaxID=215803 RepID=A0A2S9YYS8_9BACT|nr:cation diffusion facilitator family transporter [Enhygromyxa salina]PRQ10243.1 Cadmium, cobalt and zinc/H(+)-K(+) antiporter [Enhygromyxa salina]